MIAADNGAVARLQQNYRSLGCNNTSVYATMPRDDFSEVVKRVLAQRVSNRCSNPHCGAQTAGPQVDPDKSLNIGVAAHITAAAAGGPRFDVRLSPEDRASPSNGIWLCQNCAKLVDNDPAEYPADVLRAWKIIAEHEARQAIGKTRPTQTREPAVEDKWVSLEYVEKAGITPSLRAKGMNTYWVRADSEAEYTELRGWSVVEMLDATGRLVRFKVRDPQCGYLVLLAKPVTDHR